MKISWFGSFPSAVCLEQNFRLGIILFYIFTEITQLSSSIYNVNELFYSFYSNVLFFLWTHFGLYHFIEVLEFHLAMLKCGLLFMFSTYLPWNTFCFVLFLCFQFENLNIFLTILKSLFFFLFALLYLTSIILIFFWKS